jgi:uncharacterized protein (TIGR03546 family)
MILWLVQQLLLFRKFVQAQDTPRQLAWGLALGMMIGLVPKGNLLAVVLSMVLLSTRANLAVGMLSALVFSVVGMFLDPLTDPLGLAVLNHEALRPTWLRLYRLPLAPWTSLNHGVVMGSLILGLVMLYPCYRLSLPLFARYLAWRRRRWTSDATREEPDASDAPPQAEPLSVEPRVEVRDEVRAEPLAAEPAPRLAIETHRIPETPEVLAMPLVPPAPVTNATAGPAAAIRVPEAIQSPPFPHESERPGESRTPAVPAVPATPAAPAAAALPAASVSEASPPAIRHPAEAGLPAPVFLARPRRRHSEPEANRVNS